MPKKVCQNLARFGKQSVSFTSTHMAKNKCEINQNLCPNDKGLNHILQSLQQPGRCIWAATQWRPAGDTNDRRITPATTHHQPRKDRDICYSEDTRSHKNDLLRVLDKPPLTEDYYMHHNEDQEVESSLKIEQNQTGSFALKTVNSN